MRTAKLDTPPPDYVVGYVIQPTAVGRVKTRLNVSSLLFKAKLKGSCRPLDRPMSPPAAGSGYEKSRRVKAFLNGGSYLVKVKLYNRTFCIAIAVFAAVYFGLQMLRGVVA